MFSEIAQRAKLIGGNRMRWVNDDGSLGEALDFDDMQSALGKLAATRPVV